MKRQLQGLLEDCVRRIEAGEADLESCLQRYPEYANELREHLSLLQALRGEQEIKPSFESRKKGLVRLFAALEDSRAQRPKGTFALAVTSRLASALIATALLGIGAVGVSAAIGRNSLIQDTLSRVGITENGSTILPSLGNERQPGAEISGHADQGDGQQAPGDARPVANVAPPQEKARGPIDRQEDSKKSDEGHEGLSVPVNEKRENSEHGPAHTPDERSSNRPDKQRAEDERKAERDDKPQAPADRRPSEDHEKRIEPGDKLPNDEGERQPLEGEHERRARDEHDQSSPRHMDAPTSRR